MKKITNFIIDKRHFILAIFLAFTILSLFLAKDVKINYDISKYLPDNSETRKGNNIMEKEFKNTTSSLNIMFDDLKKDEKLSIKKRLASIKGVESISYDDSDEYNKDNHTLYVINVEDKADSKLAASIYQKISEDFADYTFYTSGSIDESNKTVLSIWVVAFAVFCALIILLIMCESLVEPFLFLATILMAVVLNKGTNIIFPSVSHITDSIAAILQMALSMDYSIMLMNRYDQEKKTEKNKVTAMKKALHKAFLSISSSSVTTIVGLLALVFMSFKIGKDLGFILAKGVLFSLICIFFCLPALILIFDKWIEKTKKKSPHITLTKLGQFSYNHHLLALPIFLIVLLTSFLLKGNLKIDYTDNETDEISKVFAENNQIAIIYKNEAEEQVAKNLSKLENNKDIKEVLAYGNTINEKLSYNKLNNKLKDLGSDVTVDDYLLKIVYYNYYNKENNNKLTFKEFVDFLETEAYNNQKINNHITPTIKTDVSKLKNFITTDAISQQRTSKEIASILQIDESNINDLFIYYLSKHNEDKLSLEEFSSFMTKDVLPNAKYNKQLDKNSISKLDILAKFTNKNTITTKLSSSSLANLFNIDEQLVNDLMKFYLLKNDFDLELSINDFSNFVINNVLTDSNYSQAFPEETIKNIETLALFSNADLIKKPMTPNELASLFNLDEQTINEILLLNFLNNENNEKYTLADFLNYVKLIKEKTTYLDNRDLSALSSLENSPLLNGNDAYSYDELAVLLKLNSTDVKQIYNLITYLFSDTNYEATPYELVNIILSSDTIKDKLNIETQGKLQLIKLVMDNTLTDTKFTYNSLATILNINEATVKNIYTLYLSSTENIELTPFEFVNIIISNKNDPLLENIDDATFQQLELLNTIMNSCLNNYRYNRNELSNLLGINEESLNLLYGLHNYLYQNNNYSLSLKDFIDFILDDVINNKNYAASFDQDKLTKLKTVKAIMDNSLNNTKYTKNEMFAIISKLSNNIEKDMLEVLYIYYASANNYDKNYQMTVEEFVNYLNNDILKDSRFTDFIDDDMKENITTSKKTIKDAKKLLVGKNYSRVVLNTHLPAEGTKTFSEIKNIKKLFKNIDNCYVIGDSPMAYEISKTFDDELNSITIITMLAIFIVVALTFKSLIIPLILVLIIQCAVYLTMGIFTFTNSSVYFISILIVQSILMGATIDYAILYTSYYLENRKKLGIKEAVIESLNKSIHTILTSSSILTIVTLIIASLTTAIAAKICKTISAGTICSTILILIFLPAILVLFDKFIVKKK